jgi:hypothetical protein
MEQTEQMEQPKNVERNDTDRHYCTSSMFTRTHNPSRLLRGKSCHDSTHFLISMVVRIFIHICHDSSYLLSTYHGRIDLNICNGSTDLHTCHDSTYILIYHCSICICACSPSSHFQHCQFSRLYRLHPHACCVKIIMTANASIVS